MGDRHLVRFDPASAGTGERDARRCAVYPILCVHVTALEVEINPLHGFIDGQGTID